MIKTTPFEMVFIIRDCMNFPLYEDVLRYRMIFSGVGFGVCTCFLLIILLFQTKDMWSKKRRHTNRQLRLRDYFCILIIILSLILGSKYTLECYYDIQNKAYLVWEGDFTIVKSGKSWLCYIPDQDGIRLEAVDSLPEGNFTGRVIYSEKSKVLLECHIDGAVRQGDGSLVSLSPHARMNRFIHVNRIVSHKTTQQIDRD